MKKILAVLLAVLMVASLFAGCANEKPAETTGEVANTTAAPAETTAPADTTAAPEEIVNLKWVSVGGGMPTNYEAWAVHLNEYLEEKIGVHLEMEIIGWGDWDTRRNMIVSTNEPYDIMFTNSSSYFNDVNIGAFMDIGELVETAAPELVKFIPADYWNACRINGKLYAVPTYKDSSHSQYFVYDKALVEEVYPEYKDAHTLAEAAPAVVAMSEKLGSPALILRKEGFNSICGIKFDSMSTGLDAIGVSYDDDPAHPKVVITVEQDDLLDDLKILHDLYTNGYINSDAAILDETPKYRAFNAAQGWPAAAQTSWGPNMGTEAVAVQWQKTVLSNATVQGSMNCISAACEHPEKALQLLELVNTDPIVRDALFYGLEGDNFDYVEAFGEQRVHKNNNDWNMAGYTQGSFFTVTPTDDMELNQWEEVKALNEQAHPSPILGFSFNPEPVSDELAACVAIWKEYSATFLTGTDIDCISDMLEAMHNSGLDKVIAEAQSQIDEWVAAK